MPATQTQTQAPDDPSDSWLALQRTVVDSLEADLHRERTLLAQAMKNALDSGATMTHVARTVGWSRQWCYAALSRWLPG